MNAPKKLTSGQRAYLDVIVTRGRLRQGWGGYSSTRVVRYLEERGLIRLRYFGRVGGRTDTWEASSTDKGREALEAAEGSPPDQVVTVDGVDYYLAVRSEVHCNRNVHWHHHAHDDVAGGELHHHHTSVCERRNAELVPVSPVNPERVDHAAEPLRMHPSRIGGPA